VRWGRFVGLGCGKVNLKGSIRVGRIGLEGVDRSGLLSV
jgi:hypothetical protein